MPEENTKPQLREEFKITRQGKQFVLFAGLLDLAHQIGLHSIDTDLLAIGANEDGKVRGVVKAVVEMADGRTFSGIGDADASNVGRTIAPHVIRMAETRAKARALRDAVNVGVTALEELGEEESSEVQEQKQKAEKAQRSTPTPLMATDDQRGLIVHLSGLLGGTLDQLEKQREKPFEKWNRREANAQIEALKKKAAEREIETGVE